MRAFLGDLRLFYYKNGQISSNTKQNPLYNEKKRQTSSRTSDACRIKKNLNVIYLKVYDISHINQMI